MKFLLLLTLSEDSRWSYAQNDREEHLGKDVTIMTTKQKMEFKYLDLI